MKQIEIISKRQKREKHFLQEDGTIIAKIYDDDVHFLKNNKYEEIDNQLIKINDTYTNKNNSYKVYFKENNKDQLIKYEVSGHYININLKESKDNFLTKILKYSNLINNLKYEDILENIDIEYKLLPTKVKESIIIKEKKNVPSKFDFILETDMDLFLCENGKIQARKDEQIIFSIDSPYMIDSDNQFNNNIYYELEKISNGKYELILKLDQKWLYDENTKYPIIIDPTITNYDNDSSLEDTYIYEGDSSDDRNSHEFLKVGVTQNNNSNIINRALLKFDLPNIGTGSQIISAYMTLIGYPSEEYPTDLDTINVHQVTSDWNESSANWNAMNDKYNPKVETCFIGRRSYWGWGVEEMTPMFNIANITSLVKKWYLDTPNYGVMLKVNKETYKSDLIPIFYSKNNTLSGDNPKPLLTIQYRNSNGLEDYMNYYKKSFAGGTTSINTYNGNITTVFDLCATQGSKIPVPLSLIYNTNDVVLNKNYGYGIGYKLNFYQMIHEETIDETLYLVYTDADGTLHYFKEYDGIYKDEDGLNLTILKYTNECVMNDKNGRTIIFTKINNIYYLTRITDIDGSQINIVFENNKISKIYDSSNQEISISYESDKIIIIDPIFTTTINISNNNVISIVNTMGEIIITSNDLNLISNIKGQNGLSIALEYHSQKPYRLKKLSEYGINNTTGSSINIEYGFESTTFIDDKSRVSTIVFNENGNIMSVSNLKSEDDIDNAYGKRESTGISEGKYKNKLLTSRIPVKYVNNLINDSSFENSNIKFTSSTASVLINDTEALTGYKCLYALSNNVNDILSYQINPTKGNNYTFSAYIKGNIKYKLELSYLDSAGNIVKSESDINFADDNYNREDITINYSNDANGDLTIKIIMLEIGYLYIDDIQLEVGEVVNNYNIIDNSNFSNGFNGWDLSATTIQNDEHIDLSTEEYFEVVNLSSGCKALKVKMNPENSTSIYREINKSGKEGDLYNISFWYKNNGINKSDYDYTYNNVLLNFYDDNNPDMGMGSLISTPLNPNGEHWQFYSYNFVAPRDYTSLSFNIFQALEANELYITNISLFKDIREAYYDYDDNGNATLIRGLDDEEETYQYDQNNQLVKINEPLGSYRVFEYDNNKTNLPLSSISPSGISHETIYDQNDKPIITKNKYTGLIENVVSELYYIRAKGTNLYLKYVNGVLILSEDNKDKWQVEKENEYYRISHSIINDKYLTIIDSSFAFNNQKDENGLFELLLNQNGSFKIKKNNVNKYISNYNGNINISELNDEQSMFEFYFEKADSELFIESSAEYTEDGKYINKMIDSTFNILTYENDLTKGQIKSITNSKNGKITYQYNVKNQKISINNNGHIINYNYNSNNQIDKIILNNKEYNISYDDFLKYKDFKIGNILLSTRTYENNNGNLSRVTYGNGDYINYLYDDFNRIKQFDKMDDSYQYKYDNNGNLAKIISSNENIKFTYDLAQRLHKFCNNEFKIYYEYNKKNEIISKKYDINGVERNVINSYNSDGMPQNVAFDENVLEYTYDCLGRIINYRINNNSISDYHYITNGNRTSLLLNEIQNLDDKYKYIYDVLKNITHIYKNGILTNRYKYDQLNQLIREDDYEKQKTIRIKYDLDGNIISKNEYELNTYNLKKCSTYEYGDANWKDKLTKYNNIEISYDNIGNPIKIGDSNILTWKNGRELSTYTNENYTINYKYNINGIRINKIVNNIETKYYLEDNKIVLEKTNDNMLYYMYDNNANNLI